MSVVPLRNAPTSRKSWAPGILLGCMGFTTVMCAVGAAAGDPALVLIATLVLWSVALLWSVLVATAGYVFAAFMISFFIFLLSRPTIVLIFGIDPDAMTGLYGTNFWSPDLLVQIFTLIYVSLVGLTAGTLLSNSHMIPTRLSLTRSLPRSYSGAAASLQGWSLILFLLVVPLKVVELLERGSIASGGGFYDLRTASASNLPAIVHISAGMTEVFFFAFLASMPRRKVAIGPILVYLALGIISLGTWQRSNFVLSCIVVVLYLIHRQQSDEIGEKWFSPKIALLGSLLVIPVASALQFLGDIRGRSSAETSYPLAGLIDFLYGQGVTVNVLGYAIGLESRIPDGRLFSFGPAIELVKWNLWSAITGDSYPTGQSAARAVEGHQFSHTISYLVMPDLYLRGSGYGSSFVAELWVDGGIFAVAIGATALGMFLMAVPKLLSTRSLMGTTILLMVVREVMFTPRANFIGHFITPLGASSLLGGAILLVAVLLTTRSRAAGQPRSLVTNSRLDGEER